MDTVFLKLLNMSISATWLVMAVLVLRLVLRKAPKWIHCTLWALVAIRLICPFSMESVLSLLPSGETLPQNIVYDTNPRIYSGVSVIDRTVNSAVMAELAPVGFGSVNPIQVWLFIFRVIWSLGILVMAAYALISWLRLKKRVAASLEMGEGIWLCDYIGSPFILGILRPRIYLPSSMDPETAASVLEHERAHIARRDHWWKPLGYLLLMLHWFNPILWLAYVLLCRDIEMACDEKVIQKMDSGEKQRYSEALLSCSLPRRLIAACPLAFGEVGVKARVKGILNYKKPAFWLILAAAVVCIAAAVCFLTDPAGMTLARQFGIPDSDAVVMTTGEHIHEFPEKADVKKVEAFLKSARIEPEPISQNRSEDRPKNYSVTWSNGNVQLALYFDGDFTDVWMDDGVKPSLSYRLEEPGQVKEFFESMLGMEIPDAPSGGPDENGRYYFHGTVLRVTEQSVLVEPLEGCWERSGSDRIWVSLKLQSDALLPEIRTGDRIKIVYNGMVAETYPAQVDWVYGISVVERILSDSMLQEIAAAVGESDLSLFDYQTTASCGVFGCKYGDRYGVVYLEPDGSLTVLRQENISGSDTETDFIFETSRIKDGYLCAIVTDPTVFTIFTGDSLPEENEQPPMGYAIYNFPALVVLPAEEFGSAVYCMNEDGTYRLLFIVR